MNRTILPDKIRKANPIVFFLWLKMFNLFRIDIGIDIICLSRNFCFGHQRWNNYRSTKKISKSNVSAPLKAKSMKSWVSQLFSPSFKLREKRIYVDTDVLDFHRHFNYFLKKHQWIPNGVKSTPEEIFKSDDDCGGTSRASTNSIRMKMHRTQFQRRQSPILWPIRLSSLFGKIHISFNNCDVASV